MSKINVSVDCVIFGFDDIEKKLKVLTIEKKVDPFSKKNKKRTQFAIPGDLIELEEDIDAAASRVLFSLTKLNKLYLKQFKTFGHPRRVQQEKDKEWLENFRSNPDERVITTSSANVWAYAGADIPAISTKDNKRIIEYFICISYIYWEKDSF